MGNIHLTGPIIMSNVPLTNNNNNCVCEKHNGLHPKGLLYNDLRQERLTLVQLQKSHFKSTPELDVPLCADTLAICQNIQVIYCLCLFAHFRALTSFRNQCLPKFSGNSQCFLLLKSRGVFTSGEIEHSCFEGSVHLSRTNH